MTFSPNTRLQESTEYLSLVNNAIAYVNLTVLMGSGADAWIQNVKNDYTTSTGYLPPLTPLSFLVMRPPSRLLRKHFTLAQTLRSSSCSH